ncbi:hypothetical protein QN277_019161 [Acacia crassicarpa]|nr:hypothetical protein QN277_019161 [Acacia crassicarpa]
MPTNYASMIYKYAKEVKGARKEFARVRGIKKEVAVRRRVPMEGWVKLNVDGASKGEGRIAGCGGLIWECRGKWICGYSRKLGSCSAMRAEVWAVLTGLELAIKYNCNRVVVESDSVVVVSILKAMQVDDAPVPKIVQQIGSVFCHFCSIAFVHVYREANSCADAMANYSFMQADIRVVFDRPPVVNRLLLNDYMGIAYPRLVLIQE